MRLRLAPLAVLTNPFAKAFYRNDCTFPVLGDQFGGTGYLVLTARVYWGKTADGVRLNTAADVELELREADHE